jgi:trehalose-6-phosphatase
VAYFPETRRSFVAVISDDEIDEVLFDCINQKPAIVPALEPWI